MNNQLWGTLINAHVAAVGKTVEGSPPFFTRQDSEQ